jgi:hypothetical protein
MRLQLGGAGRVNEVRINPLLNYEQVIWNSPLVILTGTPHPAVSRPLP